MEQFLVRLPGFRVELNALCISYHPEKLSKSQICKSKQVPRIGNWELEYTHFMLDRTVGYSFDCALTAIRKVIKYEFKKTLNFYIEAHKNHQYYPVREQIEKLEEIFKKINQISSAPLDWFNKKIMQLADVNCEDMQKKLCIICEKFGIDTFYIFQELDIAKNFNQIPRYIDSDLRDLYENNISSRCLGKYTNMFYYGSAVMGCCNKFPDNIPSAILTKYRHFNDHLKKIQRQHLYPFLLEDLTSKYKNQELDLLANFVSKIHKISPSIAFSLKKTIDDIRCAINEDDEYRFCSPRLMFTIPYIENRCEVFNIDVSPVRHVTIRLKQLYFQIVNNGSFTSKRIKCSLLAMCNHKTTRERCYIDNSNGKLPMILNFLVGILNVCGYGGRKPSEMQNIFKKLICTRYYITNDNWCPKDHIFYNEKTTNLINTCLIFLE